MYVLKYSNNLDFHIFQVRADTQRKRGRSVDWSHFGFEKMLKSQILLKSKNIDFLYDGSKSFWFFFVFDADYHNKS